MRPWRDVRRDTGGSRTIFRSNSDQLEGAALSADALERLASLILDLDLLPTRSTATEKLGQSLGEFEASIRNNVDFIPNFGERYRQGDTIATAFVESTITQVVSKRFVTKQQMQWTPRGAHRLLQTRTKALNDDREDAFRRWSSRPSRW